MRLGLTPPGQPLQLPGHQYYMIVLLAELHVYRARGVGAGAPGPICMSAMIANFPLQLLAMVPAWAM